jgi:hypothetical protein
MHQRQKTDENRRDQAGEIGGLHARKAAEQPEGDRRKLVVGVGQHLRQGDSCAGQGPDHDARQHQNEVVVAAPQGCPDGHHRSDHCETGPEARQLDCPHRPPQQDADDGAKPRAG